jgi:hypothetical protein
MFTRKTDSSSPFWGFFDLPPSRVKYSFMHDPQCAGLIGEDKIYKFHQRIKDANGKPIVIDKREDFYVSLRTQLNKPSLTYVQKIIKFVLSFFRKEAEIIFKDLEGYVMPSTLFKETVEVPIFCYLDGWPIELVFEKVSGDLNDFSSAERIFNQNNKEWAGNYYSFREDVPVNYVARHLNPSPPSGSLNYQTYLEAMKTIEESIQKGFVSAERQTGFDYTVNFKVDEDEDLNDFTIRVDQNEICVIKQKKTFEKIENKGAFYKKFAVDIDPTVTLELLGINNAKLVIKPKNKGAMLRTYTLS